MGNILSYIYPFLTTKEERISPYLLITGESNKKFELKIDDEEDEIYSNKYNAIIEIRSCNDVELDLKDLIVDGNSNHNVKENGLVKVKDRNNASACILICNCTNITIKNGYLLNAKNRIFIAHCKGNVILENIKISTSEHEDVALIDIDNENIVLNNCEYF